MAWVGMDAEDHLVPNPSLPWTGMPPTGLGCAGVVQSGLEHLQGWGHPQLLWAACSSASPLSEEFPPNP